MKTACNCEMVLSLSSEKTRLRSVWRDNRSDHPLYKLWSSIRSRCREGTFIRANNIYGKMNVKISKSWNEDFWTFVKDVGSKKSKRYSLDRKNNLLGYCKHNCRWATQSEQNLNRRNSKKITGHGVQKVPSGRYTASVRILDKDFYLGTFDTEKEARIEFKKYHDFNCSHPQTIKKYGAF